MYNHQTTGYPQDQKQGMQVDISTRRVRRLRKTEVEEDTYAINSPIGGWYLWESEWRAHLGEGSVLPLGFEVPNGYQCDG